MNSKLLIIGLDGATWEVLLPLINMKKLPTFEKIINKGVHGNFVSTFPPSTGPAWLSMATGKNPHRADSAASTMYNVVEVTPEPISVMRSELPEQFGDITLRCLAKNPAQRYNDAKDLLADLKSL